jgi:hypothetical protein
MVNQLEPLVATDQWIDPIQAQRRHFDTGAGKPIQMKGFEFGVGVPIKGRKKHGKQARRKEACILTGGHG